MEKKLGGWIVTIGFMLAVSNNGFFRRMYAPSANKRD
jgi:hypothetical protein